jgi:hypothetical protein
MMGYTSRTEGYISINPPITAKELRAHSELTEGKTMKGNPNRRREAYLEVVSVTKDTEDGEFVRKFSDKILVADPDEEFTRYSLFDCLKEIVAAFPDRSYSGRIVETGEDGDMWAYIVKGGEVKELHPTIVWPDE